MIKLPSCHQLWGTWFKNTYPFTYGRANAPMLVSPRNSSLITDAKTSASRHTWTNCSKARILGPISKNKKMCSLANFPPSPKKKNEKTSTRISATWISAKLWSRCAPAPRLLPCRGGGEQCAMLSQCAVIQTLHLLGTSLQQRSFPHVAATSWHHFWWKLAHQTMRKKSCTKILQLVHDIMDHHNSCHQLQFPEAKFHEYSLCISYLH